LIVAALVAGASAGLKDTASSAIKDTYNGFKDLVRRKLAGRPRGEMALAEHEVDPETWDKPLVKELTEAGAGDDAAVIEAAQALMQLVDEEGSAAGKYQVVSASNHSVAAGGNVVISASAGGTAAGVIHGNVASSDPTEPGQAHP
jgi:hypothetical protein